MDRVLTASKPTCATELGTAIYGQHFDNLRGKEILYHLEHLARAGLVEFTHTAKPPKWGRRMKFFQPTNYAKRNWQGDEHWSARLTRASSAELEERRAATSRGRTRKALLALANPRGRAILRCLMADGEAAATEVSGALSMNLHTVAYQLRLLYAGGLIELVDTDVKRGGLIKVYRPSLPPWAQMVMDEMEGQ